MTYHNATHPFDFVVFQLQEGLIRCCDKDFSDYSTEVESNGHASPLSRLIIYGLLPPWPGVKLTGELGELQHRKTRAVTTIFMTIISADADPYIREGGGGVPKNFFPALRDSGLSLVQN